MCLYQLQDDQVKLTRSVAVLNSLVAGGFMAGGESFYTAGESGTVSTFELESSQVVSTCNLNQTDQEDGQLTRVLYDQQSRAFIAAAFNLHISYI